MENLEKFRDLYKIIFILFIFLTALQVFSNVADLIIVFLLSFVVILFMFFVRISKDYPLNETENVIASMLIISISSFLFTNALMTLFNNPFQGYAFTAFVALLMLGAAMFVLYKYLFHYSEDISKNSQMM